MPANRSRRWTLLAVLFLLHALPFATRPALIGGDEPHYALAAHSLAVDGDLALANNYDDVEAGAPAAGRKRRGEVLDRHLRSFGDRSVFSHPIGLPFLAAPLLALQQWIWPGSAPDLTLGLLGLTITFAALLAACRLLESLTGSRREAHFLLFALYFSTPLWFYSRLFFTESYGVSLTVLSIYALTRGRAVLASVLLGATFLLKEPFFLLIAPVLLGTWRVAGLRRAFLLGLGPLAAFGAWLLKNLHFYGHPWVSFQKYRAGDPLEGVVGLLFDLQHGLLPFAPLLLLAPLGLWAGRSGRLGTGARLAPFAWMAGGGIFVLTAAWIDWGGGSCYGPRLVLPTIFALSLPLTLAWLRLRESRVGRAVFVALTALGFAIQLLAAFDPVKAFWSVHVAELLSERWVLSLVALSIGVGAGLMLTAQGSQRARTE